MYQINLVQGLKSFEKLLHQQGFVICQHTGQKITQLEDLVAVHLEVEEKDLFVILPVHKDNAKTFLHTIQMTFPEGLPSIEDSEPLDYHWRE